MRERRKLLCSPLSHALSHLLNGNAFTSIERANPGIDRFKQFGRLIGLQGRINFDEAAKDSAASFDVELRQFVENLVHTHRREAYRIWPSTAIFAAQVPVNAPTLTISR